MDVGEVIKALSAVATAGAAWFAAVTALKGLNKWRAEATGRRNAEVASKVLAMVYEFEEVIRSARAPWVMPHEMSKIEGIPDDVATNANYTPERRLLEHQEFFGRFRTLKHEYAAVFGKEAARAFDELWKVRIEINHAVDAMLRQPELGQSRNPEEISEWRGHYRVGFRDPDETKDVILKRVSDQVSAVEKICRPAIEARTN